jgi:serine/threonine-protein kinase RsbW
MEKTALDWKFDDRFPSEPGVCARIVEMLLERLEQSCWNNKDTFGIHMAMEEAIMNAIHHGNRCANNKQVHILIEISSHRFYSRITDEGCGFDPSQLPDPTDEENLEKSSGRGVMLMKSFVDEVIYNEIGNSVELKKKKSD